MNFKLKLFKSSLLLLSVFTISFILDASNVYAGDYTCTVSTTQCNPSGSGTIPGPDSTANCSCADGEIGVCGSGFGACRDGDMQEVHHDPPYDPPYFEGGLQYVVDGAACNCYWQAPDTCNDSSDLCYGESSCCGSGSGGPYCGDLSCNGSETPTSCPQDCAGGTCGTNAGIFATQAQAYNPPPYAPYTLCASGNPTAVTGGWPGGDTYSNLNPWTWKCGTAVCSAPVRGLEMSVSGPTRVAVNTNYTYNISVHSDIPYYTPAGYPLELYFRFENSAYPGSGSITQPGQYIDLYGQPFYLIRGGQTLNFTFVGNSGPTSGIFHPDFWARSALAYYEAKNSTPLTLDVYSNATLPVPDLKVTVWDGSGTGYSTPWLYQNVDGPVEAFYGAPTTVYWGAVSGATCTLDGASVSSAGGSKQYPGATVTVNHVLSCTNSAGTGTDTLTVKVPPRPLTLSSACAADGKSISAVWTLPAGYTSSYFRAKANSYTWPPDVISPLYTGNTYTFTTVPGTIYYFWAHTANSSNGAYSDAIVDSKTCPGLPAAVVDINADQTNLTNPNSGTTIRWTYSGATTCTLTPAIATISTYPTGSGSAPTNSLSSTRTYTLSCDPGAANDSVTVNVPAVAQYGLNVTKVGQGTVTSQQQPGIACGATCNANFDQGTVVVLTATPDTGRRFSGWGGACSGINPTCSVSINGASVSVSANFSVDPNYKEF